MNTEKPDLVIACAIEGMHSDPHKFCQITLKICNHVLGDPSAWSVVRLMIGAVSDLFATLHQQYSLPAASREFLQKLNSNELFASMYSFQWGSGEWAYNRECPLPGWRKDLFNALPLGNEIFDGECAFVLISPDDSGRIIWRDFESKEICDATIDFAYYLQQWDGVVGILKSADGK